VSAPNLGNLLFGVGGGLRTIPPPAGDGTAAGTCAIRHRRRPGVAGCRSRCPTRSSDMPITTHRPLPAELRAIQDEMEEIAAGYGLDFFETIFEVLDYEELSMFAAYGEIGRAHV